MLLLAPAAIADVLDRVTILELKLARVPADRRDAVGVELDALRTAWAGAGLPPFDEVPEYAPLAAVNTVLWDVEDRLRAAEARGEFGPAFVEDTRAVYHPNNRRATLQRAV
ncbi:MAG: hypothetical protein ACK4YP_21625, partial [Myxococcota bacterium]